MRAAHSTNLARLIAVVLGVGSAACALSASARASDASSALLPRAEGWLVKSYDQLKAPSTPPATASELAALKALVAKRTADDVARFRWWATGGPVHRWNEMILDEMQEGFVTLPLAVRHLALFHAAVDDAVGAARHQTKSATRSGPTELDAAMKTANRESAPSENAAAAAAAAEVLAYLFPARAAHFAAKGEEAIEVRLIAGVEYPHEAAAGRLIGQKIAALAIARGKSDNSYVKWTGTVPEGAGQWRGTNPIAPLAGTWQPWVLAEPSEFRPAAPPPVDSEQVKSALSELKSFPRTPKSNHRATYWEVHGGARAHTLWNEIARTKLLEHNYAAPTATRILAALNIALADVGIACWDAKYAFWYIRPPQLDPELKPLFAPPNHPSFPAAHGCFSTAAATVLAHAFPRDRDRLLALGKEAAEARVLGWNPLPLRYRRGTRAWAQSSDEDAGTSVHKPDQLVFRTRSSHTLRGNRVCELRVQKGH